LRKTGIMNFDDKAKDWDNDPKKLERAEIFSAEIIRVIGDMNVDSALEFGSGTGLASFQLKERFRHITLADTSKGMLEVLSEKIAREKLTHFNPLLIEEASDLLSLSRLDIVYTLLTLHHVADIDSAFNVFSRIIRPGGYLFIGDLVTEDGSFHYKNPEFDGHKGFDTKELVKKLSGEGFLCVEEKIFYTIERELNSESKRYPLFILAFKKE
jgi:ubiquinone/menaquinone biosynthesis C-methylase UbiE